jgi:hypothetical protein
VPYAYTNTRGITYYLHQNWVTLKGSATPRPVYYFRKEPSDNSIDAVPEGYEVYEGPRGALPMLRKKAGAGRAGG